MSDEIAHAMTSKIKRRGRCSNKRDKRLNEVKHHKKGEKWSDAKKLEAATYFAVYGSPKKAAELCGVGVETVRTWRKSDWWEDVLSQVRKSIDDELDGQMTGIMTTQLNRISDIMENGEEKYVPQHDKFIRVQPSLRDLALSFSTLNDKRNTNRAIPKQLENISTQKKLTNLLENFVKFTQEKTIEGEVIENDNEGNS